ncbi:MAG: GatB/YqeY domain-containing protein [Bdellovibrionales bacterium]|nr:GatB/YqeY domain-containing protein [Bdellovibrionales bacterium]
MSQLKSKIMDDVKAAMKNKEADRLSAIRFLQAAIKNKEIDVRPNTITDEDIMGVIKKMAKQRKDSIEQFQKAGRQDLADKESFELSVIEEYLPAQMSEEQVTKVVNEVIQALNASSMKDMGAVMKEVQAKTQGAADGKLISQIVKAKLQ